jgi:ABC-type sugar transport system substrate-binding protein
MHAFAARHGRARRAVAATAAAVLALLTACSTGAEPSPAPREQDGPIQVGAIMYARDLEFWQLVEAGMRDAARELDVPLNVDVSNRQLQTESQLIDTMYARGDNVLIAAPIDLTASAANLERARERGMTIVQYDNRVDDPSFEHFVGVDQTALGEALGRATQAHLDEKYGGRAKVALLTGDTEPNGPPRREAFLREVPGADVVTSAEAVGSPEAGARAFETVLQSNPDIQVVWAWNGAALQGAATAAERLGAQVEIFGIDMSRQVADLMAAPGSPVVAVADQHAYDVGYSALRTGVLMARGEDVAPTTNVEPTLFTVDDPAALESFRAELAEIQ